MITMELCRRHAISAAAFYNWKAIFGGVNVSDARRLKLFKKGECETEKIAHQLHVGCPSPGDTLARKIGQSVSSIHWDAIANTPKVTLA